MSMGKSRASSKHTPAGKAVKHGGGYGSLKVREKREATRERPRVRAANPSAISDWGAHRGNHASDGSGSRDMPFKNEKLYAGPSFQPCEFGNSKALEGAGSGARPGGGKRTVFERGSQQQYGPSAPAAKDYSVDVPATARSQRSLSEKGRVG
jgi:hypothetical protein